MREMKMKKGQTWSMFAEQLERILPKREVLGVAWEKVDEDRWIGGDWRLDFKAGDVMKADVRVGESLWLNVWVARDGKDGKDGKEFDTYPKCLKLHWLRTARETAHHVCAIIGLVADAIEHRSIPADEEEEE